MIASDEIIVPQAGQGISDSPPAAGSAWTATFTTGFATCATATGICAAGFATTGAGLDCTGWGRSPTWGAGVVGTALTETAGIGAGAGPRGFDDCFLASDAFSPSGGRVPPSPIFSPGAREVSFSPPSLPFPAP